MQDIALEIQKLVCELPGESIEKLISFLQNESDVTSSYEVRTRIQRMLPDQKYKGILEDFFADWAMLDPNISAQGLVLAFRAAYSTMRVYKKAEQIELVWTGPKVASVPMRRTEEVLIDLINGAQDRIHIVSFVVYCIKSVSDALQKAVDRGVKISLYLETPDSKKIDYDTINALGSNIKKLITLFEWPVDKRSKVSSGHYGTLHAKLAVADGKVILISSANLTEYALSINLEAGVLISGGTKPALIEQQLTELVAEGIFVKI